MIQQPTVEFQVHCSVRIPYQLITTDYLLDSTRALQKPKGMPLIPHQFISRGDSGKPIEQEQDSRAEYFATIRRITAHPAFPQSALAALYKHVEDLSITAISWDWPTCRRWSEKVFKLVGDGRLKLGWNDTTVIKNLQQDICTEAVHALQARSV